MATPIMEKPQSQQVSSPAQINNTPQPRMSMASVQMAQDVQAGINRGFENAQTFTKVFQEMAYKRQKLAEDELSWRYSDAVARTMDDIQSGRVEYGDVAQAVESVSNRFNDSVKDRFSSDFIAKWRQSQGGMKTLAVSETEIAGQYLKAEYKYQVNYAQDMAQKSATLAFVDGDYDGNRKELEEFVATKTALNKSDANKILESYDNNYWGGRVLRDVQNRPEYAVNELKNNPEYAFPLKNVERARFIKMGEGLLEGKKAAGKTNNVREYYASMFMDNPDIYNDIVEEQIEALDNKDTRELLFNSMVARGDYEDSTKGKAKFLDDLNKSVKYFAQTVRTPEQAMNAERAKSSIEDLSVVVSGVTDGYYKRTQPLNESARKEFDENISDKLPEFVKAVADFRKEDRGTFDNILGKEYENNMKGINSSIKEFFEVLQDTDKTGNKALSRTAYGKALIRFNDLIEQKNPSGDKQNVEWLKTKMAYMNLINELGQRVGLEAGRDTGFMGISGRFGRESNYNDKVNKYNIIADKVLKDMFQNEFNLSVYDPDGIVDQRASMLIGGDLTNTSGRKAAVNRYSWDNQ